MHQEFERTIAIEISYGQGPGSRTEDTGVDLNRDAPRIVLLSKADEYAILRTAVREVYLSVGIQITRRQ
jgi:hypothetical protein